MTLITFQRTIKKVHFTIIFSDFFYPLDIFSLFHRFFFNNTELKIFGHQWELNLGLCKRSATELGQPAGKQTLQSCIYTIKGYCYAIVSLSTNQLKKIVFFQRFFLLLFFLNLFIYFFWWRLNIFKILYCLIKPVNE